jgi:lipopolysaccharide biosynthesis glycosyltransferase
MENKDRIPIAFVTDQNYLNHTIVTLTSILNNSDQKYIVYILYTNIDEPYRQSYLEKFQNSNASIEFIEFNAERYKNYIIHNKNLSLTTYAKFDIPDLIPEDKIIYLDSDIIVVSDLIKLWQLFDPQYSVMAVPNPPFPKWKDHDTIGLSDHDKSFNAGVLFLNLLKIRKENSAKSLFSFADQYHDIVLLHDESAFNYVYKNDWKPLPYYFNCTTLFFRRNYNIVGLTPEEYQDLQKNMTIIHFTGRDKPWSVTSPHPKNKEWKKYSKQALGKFTYSDFSVRNLFIRMRRKVKFVYRI